ncbi:MAG: enoyl-CoA hydratase, partial [Rhizobiales bacterium]|nr:enoyl-CoA hydratase [Hyphomicrobiales bacterium]
MTDAVETDHEAQAGGDEAEPVLIRHDAHGIAGLTLNRPSAFNALNRELLSALQREFDAIGEDPEVRVVAITGNGRAFCAGHDLKEMAGERQRDALLGLFGQCSRMMLTLARLPQPVARPGRTVDRPPPAGCRP